MRDEGARTNKTMLARDGEREGVMTEEALPRRRKENRDFEYPRVREDRNRRRDYANGGSARPQRSSQPRTSPWLTIGLPVGGGILLVGLIVLIIVLASGGDSDQGPVQANKDKQAPKEKADGKVEAKLEADPKVTELTTLDVHANDLAYDKTRGLIYAAVSSLCSKHGNTVSAIDPARGTVVWSVDVGHEPSTLSLSDDGKALWLGFRGASAIQRIDLDKRKASALHPLPTTVDGPMFAEKVLVLAGTTDSLAVSHYYKGQSPGHAGVGIYDNGVPRALKTQDHTGSNRLAHGPDAGTLMGYCRETTEFGLRYLSVEKQGVTEGEVRREVIGGHDTDIVYAGGRLYATSGAVVDAKTCALVGTIPARGPLAVDPAGKIAYFLIVDKKQVAAFDTEKLRRISARAVPMNTIFPEEYGSLVLVGKAALAYRMKNKIVVVPLADLENGRDNQPPLHEKNIAKKVPSVKKAGTFEGFTVDLKAHSLCHDPTRGHVYASIGSSSGNYANSVVALNPETGGVVWSVDVGSDPGPLALSDNGKVLWVGLSGSPSVQRIDLEKRKAGAQFPLGSNQGRNTLFAEKILVMPGKTDTIVVSLYSKDTSPRHGGVAVYDNGVRRAQLTRSHTGSNRLTLSSEPGVLFGYNNETTEFGLRRLEVDKNGVRETNVYQNLVQGDADILFAGSRLYATSGTVVDAKSCTCVGTLPARGSVVVDPAKNRAYLLNCQEGAIQSFDSQKLTKCSSCKVDVPRFQRVPPTLVLAGTAALAFPHGDQIVFVSRKNLD